MSDRRTCRPTSRSSPSPGGWTPLRRRSRGCTELLGLAMSVIGQSILHKTAKLGQSVTVRGALHRRQRAVTWLCSSLLALNADLKLVLAMPARFARSHILLATKEALPAAIRGRWTGPGTCLTAFCDSKHRGCLCGDRCLRSMRASWHQGSSLFVLVAVRLGHRVIRVRYRTFAPIS
jgi:hypothetical protein